MKDSYYKPCRELDICDDLIERYFEKDDYAKKRCAELGIAINEK